MTTCAPFRACAPCPCPASGPSSRCCSCSPALLNLWALSRNGWANEYYAGAVRSMASSWHAFFYGALDSAGVMTVDKPPLALWVQALSVRVFGFSSWSMLVPQALMGVASVGLVYDLVAAALRARGRLRGRRRARADADRGGGVAPQQPGRAARPVRRGRAVGAGAGLGGRARALGRAGRRCAWVSASRPRWAPRCSSSRRCSSRGCGPRRATAGAGSPPAAPRWSRPAARGRCSSR